MPSLLHRNYNADYSARLPLPSGNGKLVTRNGIPIFRRGVVLAVGTDAYSYTLNMPWQDAQGWHTITSDKSVAAQSETYSRAWYASYRGGDCASPRMMFRPANRGQTNNASLYVRTADGLSFDVCEFVQPWYGAYAATTPPSPPDLPTSPSSHDMTAFINSYDVPQGYWALPFYRYLGDYEGYRVTARAWLKAAAQFHRIGTARRYFSLHSITYEFRETPYSAAEQAAVESAIRDWVAYAAQRIYIQVLQVA
jgi:hypothetical protein